MKQDEPRLNGTYIILGKTRSGKSTFIVQKIIPSYITIGMKVNLFYKQGNSAYDELRNEDGTAKDGINLYCISKIDQLLPIIKSSWNSVFFFDDCLSIIGKRMPIELEDLMRDNGMKNNESFFVYHGFKQVHSPVMVFAEKIICFITNDSPRSKPDFFSVEQYRFFDKEKKRLKKLKKKFQCFELPYNS